MEIKAKTIEAQKAESDVVVLFLTAENWKKELERGVSSETLLNYLSNRDFEAKEGEIEVIPGVDNIKATTLVLYGLGKQNELTLTGMTTAVAKLSRRLRSKSSTVVSLDLTHPAIQNLKPFDLAKACTEGAILGSYQYLKFKSEAAKERKAISELWYLVPAAKLQHTTNGIREGQIFAEATLFARDLINEPPTSTTPTYLAEMAKSLTKRGVKVEILEEAQIKKLGMNSFLAVSKGSEEPPKFIKLTYKGGGSKKVALVGKAITFDTGGLSIKDAKNMETMKLDMSGGASVLGVFHALSLLKPKVNVVGLIAACENAVGPRAMKPGDIVTAMNGKTIEILNTDAEGRLTLADSLNFAVREKPDYIVDLATLTGACMVALGEDVAGLFGNNEALTKLLLQSAKETGEKIWELPLEKNYLESVKSHIADLRNISGTRYGGAITAALFLEKFVDKVPWSHIDIAGPAFAEKDTPLSVKGGVGFGVRTLLQFVRQI